MEWADSWTENGVNEEGDDLIQEACRQMDYTRLEETDDVEDDDPGGMPTYNTSHSQGKHTSASRTGQQSAQNMQQPRDKGGSCQIPGHTMMAGREFNAMMPGFTFCQLCQMPGHSTLECRSNPVPRSTNAPHSAPTISRISGPSECNFPVHPGHSPPTRTKKAHFRAHY